MLKKACACAFVIAVILSCVVCSLSRNNPNFTRTFMTYNSATVHEMK